VSKKGFHASQVRSTDVLDMKQEVLHLINKNITSKTPFKRMNEALYNMHCVAKISQNLSGT